MSGSAGIGLFLLAAAERTGSEPARELAVAAGRRLVELAKEAPGGLRWEMSPGFPRTMPNFSHGTSGIAYSLASLYQHTKDRRYLDAALSGAKYLDSIAVRTDGATVIRHHDGADGENLFYLSWCHGPVGTARLFYRLFESTGNDEWMRWVRMSARGALRSAWRDCEANALRAHRRLSWARRSRSADSAPPSSRSRGR